MLHKEKSKYTKRHTKGTDHNSNIKDRQNTEIKETNSDETQHEPL